MRDVFDTAVMVIDCVELTEWTRYPDHDLRDVADNSDKRPHFFPDWTTDRLIWKSNTSGILSLRGLTRKKKCKIIPQPRVMRV